MLSVAFSSALCLCINEQLERTVTHFKMATSSPSSQIARPELRSNSARSDLSIETFPCTTPFQQRGAFSSNNREGVPRRAAEKHSTSQSISQNENCPALLTTKKSCFENYVKGSAPHNVTFASDGTGAREPRSFHGQETAFLTMRLFVVLSAVPLPGLVPPLAAFAVWRASLRFKSHETNARNSAGLPRTAMSHLPCRLAADPTL
jgi:hypothetical protein